MADYFRKCDGQKLEIRIREMLGWLLSYQILSLLRSQDNATVQSILSGHLFFVLFLDLLIK